MRLWIYLLLAGGMLQAQPSCPPTPVYKVCDMAFELDDAQAKAHPNPYVSVELRGEFRSPRHRTLMVYGFWDGGRKMVIRFAPNEVGDWEFRITSNLTQYEGKQGTITATTSDAPGFLRAANMHHWAYSDSNKPHLWMSDTSYDTKMSSDAFHTWADSRAAAKYTHLRALGAVFSSPDIAALQALDERVRYTNEKGLVFDMVLSDPGEQRDRYVRYMAARYSAFHMTWQVFQAFEEVKNGRPLAKEIGMTLKKFDPYQHPKTAGANVTSSPMAGDGWMDYIVYSSSDDQLGSIEHQLYAMPFVNAGIAVKDPDALRRQLWNTTMNGQYVGSIGVAEPKQMTVWFEFFSDSRHWELEPYFDVDGGRAVALEGVEYVLYVEKPGPVELRVERHGYDVAWINPATGEQTKLKNYKGEKFAAEPPDATHDWVLYLSREGKKQSMLESYKFDSREVSLELQEIEGNTQKLPFVIVEPSKDEVSVSKPPSFAAKLRRESRATRQMMYLWTGEVVIDGLGARVFGTGKEGVFRIPPFMAANYPAILNLRLVGMNANGKVYMTDKVYTLKP
ncbi:MAG: DUF5060 domain-containing protein [Bryobacteraceae bacterium]